MRLAGLALVFAPLLTPDLDVGVPPGTPLEWTRELRRPAPTGYRGRVPPAASRGSTVVEERYLTPGPVRLYDYFNVTTRDIGTHIKINLPTSTGLVSSEDRRDEVRASVAWNYPPRFPVELVWMGMMAALRLQIHPQVVSTSQTLVYCLEIGEPAAVGVKGWVQDDYGALRNVVKPLPLARPDVPTSKDPKQAMFLKLATIELSGGFPHALDPTYARRTLALGDEGYKSVVECTKSAHPFLARNAVAVLAQYPNPEASEELKKLWKETKDSVTRVRAAMGLIRRRETSILNDLVADAKGDNAVAQAIAVYGLGLLGDPAGAQPVIDLINAGPGDLGSTAVPALGRMTSGKDALLAYEAKLRQRYEGDDTVRTAGNESTPTAEEAGASAKILRQMCVIALAMNGEKAFADEMNQRVAKSGLDGFHRATHYLLVEALALSDEGAKLLKSQILEAPCEDVFRVEGLRALAAAKRVDGGYLNDRALDVKRGEASRATALSLLADRDEKLARDACRRIIEDYGQGRALLPGLVCAAAEIGGRRGHLELQPLLTAVERARTTGAVARRESNDDTDITRAEVRIHPPLLETLVIELGRLRSDEAIHQLRLVLNDVKTPQGRAEAVLALGAIEGKDADALIVSALDDRDGWVRYCAYKAAGGRVGQDYFCNWIFGTDEERAPSVQMYRTALR